MNEPTIYIRHIFKAGMCERGAREWFKSHGLSFRDMLRNGLKISDTQHITCALLERVKEEVYKENGNGRRG
ncbi:tail assembly chaperone [Burkholderia phage BcepNazgul]|uniref:Conserved tail assembly protein n=1 Tax=Burkholderia phage BcepNazgul TaxID=242861 RepID=Q6UYJ7_9CAUD|nr:tail assembly chaperone [Burkholderia phage BcepNazgul]AAQ63344.1 conserved tail assembly protein [Burkholderia phage BcepNazgul]